MINLTSFQAQQKVIQKEEQQSPPTARRDFIDFGLGLMNPAPSQQKPVIAKTHRGKEVVKAEENKDAGLFDNLFTPARRGIHGIL